MSGKIKKNSVKSSPAGTPVKVIAKTTTTTTTTERKPYYIPRIPNTSSSHETGYAATDAELKELLYMEHAVDVVEGLQKGEEQEEAELDRLVAGWHIHHNLSEKDEMVNEEAENLAKAAMIVQSISRREDKKPTAEEHRVLDLVAKYERRILANQKEKNPQLHNLLQARQSIRDIPHTADKPVELKEAERLANAAKIFQNYEKLHDVTAIECERLAKAAHIADSLNKRDEKTLTVEEVETFAIAALVQEKLCQLEAERLSALSEVNRLQKAARTETRLIQTEFKNPSALEVSQIYNSYRIFENLARKDNEIRAALADLYRANRIYHEVHHAAHHHPFSHRFTHAELSIIHAASITNKKLQTLLWKRREDIIELLRLEEAYKTNALLRQEQIRREQESELQRLQNASQIINTIMADRMNRTLTLGQNVVKAIQDVPANNKETVSTTTTTTTVKQEQNGAPKGKKNLNKN